MTTQVTAEDTRCPPEPVDEQPEGEWKGTRSRVGVALGSTWAYCVNTQLVMEFLTKELRKVRSGRNTYPTAIRLCLGDTLQPKGIVWFVEHVYEPDMSGH